MQTGEIGYKEASTEAKKVRAKSAGTAIPEVDNLAAQLTEYIDGLLSRSDPNTQILNETIRRQKRLGKDSRRRLKVALDKLSDRCLRFDDSLESP
ncbi:MAG: hypothetical protein ACLQNE_24850 [Thermoguttaceae bacterium]